MTEQKKRQSTLAGEAKKEVFALLKEHYPDFLKHFTFKTESWSTGGRVEITWTDGPSRDEIDALLAPLKETYSIISLWTSRRFTLFFLTRVAKEVCAREGWDMPKIEVTENGYAFVNALCLNHIYTGIYHEAYKTSMLEEKE